MRWLAVLLVAAAVACVCASGCGTSRPEPTKVERKFSGERKVLQPPGKAAKAK